MNRMARPVFYSRPDFSSMTDSDYDGEGYVRVKKEDLERIGRVLRRLEGLLLDTSRQSS